VGVGWQWQALAGTGNPQKQSCINDVLHKKSMICIKIIGYTDGLPHIVPCHRTQGTGFKSGLESQKLCLFAVRRTSKLGVGGDPGLICIKNMLIYEFCTKKQCKVQKI
jgi:hypothetical protein